MSLDNTIIGVYSIVKLFCYRIWNLEFFFVCRFHSVVFTASDGGSVLRPAQLKQARPILSIKLFLALNSIEIYLLDDGGQKKDPISDNT